MLRYEFRTGVKKQTRSQKLWVVSPLVLLLVGAYLTLNSLSPTMNLPFGPPSDATAKKLVASPARVDEDRLYIPQINVDVAIAQGSESVLDQGAWHRNPQNGDPVQGGNFVLAAHRFDLGFTPQQTRAKSPFYHIDKLKSGDQIYVDFDGVRYAYEITKQYDVKASAVEIEQKTSEPRLTMYSCDLSNPKAIRYVLEAKQIGTIAWVGGVAKLKSNQF